MRPTVARRLKLAAAALVAVLAVLIFGYVPYWLAGMATTRRFEFRDLENAGLTPASFKLVSEDVSFTSPDGVPLKGWWVSAPNARGTVILVHGLYRKRIEMVKKVPFVVEHGWNALLFDLRHHGESGGAVSTFGYYEKGDAKAAIAYARSRAPGPIVLWGVSLGAATAALAAAEDPTIAGLICDSSYRSLRDTVGHHLNLFRGFRWWLRFVPSWPVASEVVYWIGRRGHFDPDAVDVRGAAAHLQGRPALFVCNSGDRRMPKEIAFELKAAAGDHARVLVVPGTSHGGAYRDATAAYQTAVAGVLDEAAKTGKRMASGS
jgi:pimeloyl-ACP methyl ester carboxylesterase